MGTYEAVLRDVTSPAVIEAAQRFTSGLVPSQSATFAPSIAEFAQEARRVDGVIPYRNRERLPAPDRGYFHHDDEATRIRMGFKMSVLSHAIGIKRVDDVAQANREGLESMMALAQTWGLPIPEQLWPARQAAE